MSTNVLPTREESTSTRAPNSSSSMSKPSSGSLVKYFVIAGVIVIATAIYFAWPAKRDPNQTMLTHTVSRGNLTVSVIEQGTLESSDNTEIKCKVRGSNTITWVIEGGTQVKKGEVLLRLDTLALDESISEREKFKLLTLSSAKRLDGNRKAAKLAIDEYLKGQYRTELMTLEKELAVAKSNLQKIQDLQKFTEKQVKNNYANKRALEQINTSVAQSRQQVAAKERAILLLEDTKKEQVETLQGNLRSIEKSYRAEFERSRADEQRWKRAVEELVHCTVVAPRDGLVIYPNAARWKNTPDIEEGASVHKDQVLLLMPDIDNMQIKVGVHESVVDRVREGLIAKVTLPRQDLTAKVSEVARVTKPAGWWTGNVVKYDTIIKLPQAKGLKPGMSAEVEIILAEHEDVITIPVAAVVESEQGNFSWVKKGDQLEKRLIQLGDSNDVFIVVTGGIAEGEEVVLNPLAHIDEAQRDALRPSIKGTENELEATSESEQDGKKDNKTKTLQPQAKSAN